MDSGFSVVSPAPTIAPRFFTLRCLRFQTEIERFGFGFLSSDQRENKDKGSLLRTFSETKPGSQPKLSPVRKSRKSLLKHNPVQREPMRSMGSSYRIYHLNLNHNTGNKCCPPQLVHVNNRRLLAVGFRRWRRLPLHFSTPSLSPAVNSGRGVAAGRLRAIPFSLTMLFITRFKRYHSTGDCLPKRFPISPSRPLNFLYQTQWAKSDPRTSVIQVSLVSLRIFNEWGISTATPRDPS
ncbi:hypothetical protein LXL04_027161 [Taraxacum kok-saghyz]